MATHFWVTIEGFRSTAVIKSIKGVMYMFICLSLAICLSENYMQQVIL